MAEATVHRSDQRMDEIMGGLLRTGVVLAAAIVLVGGVVYLTRHRVPVMDVGMFRGSRETCGPFRGFSMRLWRFVGEG